MKTSVSVVRRLRHERAFAFHALRLFAATGLISAVACETVIVAGPEVVGAIAGQVTVRGGGALPDVTVRVSGVHGDSTVTDANGNYTFPSMAGGDYTVTVSDFPANVTFSPAQQSVTVAADGASVTVNFEGNYPPVDVTTTTLAAGRVGSPYADSVRATGGGGPLSFSIVDGSLPDGLTLAAGTGVISGTPTTARVDTFAVQAAASADSATAELTILVLDVLQVATTSLRLGIVDASYADTLRATGGDGNYTWSIDAGSLPANVSLDASTGILSGAPSAMGPATFTVKVESGDGQAVTRELTLAVQGAATLAVTGITDPITGGATSDVTVTALDLDGNVATGYTGTITFTSSDGSATLPADYTFTAGDAGVRVFPGGVTLVAVGEQSVSATDTSVGTITGTQAEITVEQPVPTSLTMTGITDPITAGEASDVTVTVLDQIGNVLTDYTGTITFTSSDGAATLPVGYTFTAGDNGVRVFPGGVTLETAGEHSVTATDVVEATLTDTQIDITVEPAPAETHTVTGITDPIVGGGISDVTVTAMDSFGNVATDYTGTITFTSSDGSATLPADYTFTAGDNGTRVFAGAVTLVTVGEQSVTATDTSVGTITGTQTEITVEQPVPTSLSVTGITDPITAGDASGVTVTVLDQIGNVLTGYTGTITFTSSDGAATLPADYTFTAGDNGVRVFPGGVTLETAGEQSVTATDVAEATITGAQTEITVEPAAAETLSVVGITDPIVGGGSSNVTVTAMDPFGNVATGYTGTITFTSSDGSATLPGDHTFAANDAGVRVLVDGVTMVTVGEQSVTATDTSVGTITGTQADITVEQPVPTSLSVTGITDPIEAGDPSDVTVTAIDQIGNVAPGYTGTITFTSSDGAATLPADYTFTVGDNGVRVLSGGVGFMTGGEQSVTATDVTDGSITGSQTGISVRAPLEIFTDDFEGGLGLWSASNGIWAVGLPTSGPSECRSGSQCAATVLAGNYPQTNSSFQSPTINLPAVGPGEAIQLRFWHWFSFNSDIFGADAGVVYIQERLGPGQWSSSTQLARYTGGSGGVWTRPLVDLSAFGGKTVRLLFHLSATPSRAVSSGWYFDDVSVTLVEVDNGVPFSDGFERGLGDWWASRGTWQVGTPAAGPGGCNNGSQCAGTRLDGNYPQNNSSLVSPQVTLPSIGANEELHLRFWHWFSLNSDIFGADAAVVYVQERLGPGDWSSSVELSRYTGGSGGVWTRPLVDLSAYAGETVRLLFHLSATPSRAVSSGWYFDDISITVVQANNPLPYADGFESGLGNWWASRGTWEVGGPPAAGPGACNDGNQCAGTRLDGNYPQNNSSLVSPTLTLPTIGLTQEIHLRFWHWFSLNSDIFGADAAVVYVQERLGPGDWSGSIQLARYTGGSGGWSRPLVDLSAYGGSTVRLLFHLSATPSRAVSSGWYVDDVSVSVIGS